MGVAVLVTNNFLKNLWVHLFIDFFFFLCGRGWGGVFVVDRLPLVQPSDLRLVSSLTLACPMVMQPS